MLLQSPQPSPLIHSHLHRSAMSRAASSPLSHRVSTAVNPSKVVLCYANATAVPPCPSPPHQEAITTPSLRCM
ncbi:hypothetical protein M0R45_015941 [Rubus argutus]|uniref:Uncharacterized protein n=1 Tax=Rubus argutus TaxID=59490 RepID=A0AAW1XTN8_RUBAR